MRSSRRHASGSASPGADPLAHPVSTSALDDLGAENSTPWVNETLFQLINYRYNNELPTIFTSNAEVDGVEDRIRSRMLDNSFTERWAIQAPDYRLTAHSAASGLLHSEGNAAPTAEAAAPSPRRGRRKR